MNTSKLKTKQFLIPAAVVVVALAIGVAFYAWMADPDLRGSERERVSAAAREAAGGGKVIDAEKSDDPGEAYDVEVRKSDGSEVDVHLDKDLNVVRVDGEDRRDSDDRGRDDSDGPDDGPDAGVDDGPDDARDDDSGSPDADDRPLTAQEVASAEEAAVAAVGGGTVVDVDASDDRGVAYEVEVRKPDNTEWKVELDAEFKALRTARED